MINASLGTENVEFMELDVGSFDKIKVGPGPATALHSFAWAGEIIVLQHPSHSGHH